MLISIHSSDLGMDELWRRYIHWAIVLSPPTFGDTENSFLSCAVVWHG